MAFRVDDQFRTNPRSHVPGGAIVYVKFWNGQVREYDKIDYPWNFIKKVKKENPNVKSAWYRKENKISI